MSRHFFLLVFIYTACTAFAQDFSYEQFQKKQYIIERHNSQWSMSQPYVILISIDGFRYDYAEKFDASNIPRLAKNGASAKRMLPSFPSKTFPNHYTIVTGQYPGTHGIVSNEFYSRTKDAWYSYRSKEAVTDSSWYSGVPIWTLAEQNEMVSASLFWVGSEARIGGFLPTYRYAYDGKVPNSFRIRQITDWLNLPEQVRPHLILGYFSLVDDAGHRYGPDHEETRKAVLEIDELVGHLMLNLQNSDLPVHLVLVSDHGMSAINRGVVLPELVDLGDSEVSYSFPPMIYQKDSAEVNRIYQELLAIPLIDVYKQENVPEYLSFENAERVGDLILESEAPTIILPDRRVVSGGTHGFNPFTNKEMGAIFYAYGPKIKRNHLLPPFENIHVYPFIAQILGLTTPECVEGSGQALQSAFK